jgi:acylaminoacyl-peptidase
VGEEKDGTFTCLTPSDRLARSPRFVVDVKADDESSSTKLVWLSNSQGFDTHGGCMGLSSLDWNTDNGIGVMMETRKSIVDVIHHPEDDDAFPGLFLNQLPLEPFVSKDGKYLFVTTQWRSTIKVVKISIATGDVLPVTFNLKGDRKMSGSQTLLCMTSTGDAIVTQSEPSDTPALGFVSSTSLLREGNDLVPSILIAEFGPVAATSKFPAKSILNESEKLSYRIIRTHPQHGDVQAPVEGILLLPPNSKREKVPLVVVPHGGPHSCTPTAYIPSYAYLCQGGKFGILHVNYRGSTGFGQAALESLAGNIGDQDVRDVVHLTKHVLEEFKDEVDASKVGVCGGSHGGFLAGHLIGQYPELFKVAAMRNPVTNIATMTTATDIPDWTYVECLGPNKYDWTTFCGPNKADLSAMWDASRKWECSPSK